MQVESNRNPEKQSKPFSLYDFTFWADVAEKPKPPSAAGAALIELINRNLLPSFAFDGPWLADLEQQGRNEKPPERLCWAADDAIILAPYRQDQEHWSGFLIAKAAAAGTIRKFHNEQGQALSLRLPDDIVTGSAFAGAKAGAQLQIVR